MTAHFDHRTERARHEMSLALISLLLLAATTASAQSDSAYFTDVLYLGRTYVNDHALIYRSGAWHLFFTNGDMSIRPWMSPGNEIDIDHAVSTDLRTWTLAAPALQIGPPGSLDAAHIYAPSVIEAEGRYWMLYTGNARGFFSGEQIMLASSSDLMTWTRESYDAVLRPDSSWATYYPRGYDSGYGGPVSCRDPFVITAPDGGYICYYVARMREDSSGAPARACVAAATSNDLRHWIDRGPVLTRPVFGDDVNPYTHPESPCVVVRDGRYTLFWKGGSGTRYATSDNPLNFEDAEERFLATSHASKVFEWRGNWYITSCSRNLNDVMHTHSDRTRGLFLAGLTWDGDAARLTTLPIVSHVDDAADAVEGQMMLSRR